MAKLTTGAWRLRFLTIDKETDELSFLTNNGVGNQVTVEPGIQPIKQTWFAVPVEGEEDLDHYTIIQDPSSNSPPGLAYADDGSNKVILSKQPGNWRFDYVSIDIPNVYKISVSLQPVPFPQLLGKDGHEAVIQIQFPGIKIPAWQFVIAE